MGSVDSVPLIYVLDDDASVRRSLARLIRTAGFEARTFASASEFLENGLADQPSCLVVDVRMPGPSGLDLQESLSAAGWLAPIIFITGHGDVPTSVRAMRAGAVNFLQKPFEDEVILAAIREAVERGSSTRRDRRRREEIAHLLQTLTPREREVFALVVAGLPNKRIANQLGASEKTVKVHRGRVMGKMRAASLADLVHMAYEVGISVARMTERVPGWPGLGLAGEVGPRSNTQLVGASEVFVDDAAGGRSRSSGAGEWRWSKARRSSPSSGSS
jgi:RNA polymerase sigma factor (sigma-70 family)